MEDVECVLLETNELETLKRKLADQRSIVRRAKLEPQDVEPVLPPWSSGMNPFETPTCLVKSEIKQEYASGASSSSSSPICVDAVIVDTFPALARSRQVQESEISTAREKFEALPWPSYRSTGPRASKFLVSGDVATSAWSHLAMIAPACRNNDIHLKTFTKIAKGQTQYKDDNKLFTDRVYIDADLLPPAPQSHASIARALGVKSLTKDMCKELKLLLPQDMDMTPEQEEGGSMAEDQDGPVYHLPSQDDCDGIVRAVGKALGSKFTDKQCMVVQAGLDCLQNLTESNDVDKTVPLVSRTRKFLISSERPSVAMLIPGSAPRKTVDKKLCESTRQTV